jgi:predicted dehydrogenase
MNTDPHTSSSSPSTPSPSLIGRRQFLVRSLAAGATLGFPSLHAAGANDEIRLAIVGLRSRGKDHIDLFKRIKGVKVVALCDPDRKILEERARQQFDGKVGTHVDYREVLERDDVDAVCIATPNHWHALAAVWACQAGKDVYVEKPVSHNIWEGRQIVKAARKHERIVQTGTQSRSAVGTREFIADLHSGKYGKVKLARGLCYKRRGSIGKVPGPQTVPDHIDYNLWAGPREAAPVMRRQFHYDWHWQWPFGNGDLGNQGIHQMDLCRWALGEQALAPRVISLGGRFGYDDDGQTPNSQVVILDYEAAPLVFEVRGLTDAKGVNNMSHYRGGRVSMVIECEAGYFVGTNGGTFFDNDGKKMKGYGGGVALQHHQNFIDAVRSRKSGDLHADILDGHLSSALCHQGNISQQLGSAISREQLEDQCNDKELKAQVFERLLEHSLVHEKDFTERKMILGPSLDFDPAAEQFTGQFAGGANALVKDDYREPFVVPEIA